jgi:hypothetical protein
MQQQAADDSRVHPRAPVFHFSARLAKLHVQFLNKVDILTRKIQSGVRFAEHVTSYRNKPNEPKEVIKCTSEIAGRPTTNCY